MKSLVILSAYCATWLMTGAMATSATGHDALRCIMYLTGQHIIFPPPDLSAHITHVILAFMRSDVFCIEQKTTTTTTTAAADWPLFLSVDDARAHFATGTKVTVAIGGWGDTGFEEAARDEASRARWAGNVGAMVDATGADGVDIDWEYPGGNRDDYKQTPNAAREWEIEAFVQLLGAIRAAIGPDKLLSIAVPGKADDLIAFTPLTVPRISQHVDFINVMTYDLMNRRDTAVKHHSGAYESQASLQRYIDRGAPPSQLNLGLGYYAKWFMTAPDCDPASPIGCETQQLEDPDTGSDLGRTGGFSWHDAVPTELSGSFGRAQASGTYSEGGRSYGYWDAGEARWWTFDTAESARRKTGSLVRGMGLGGVFAWGLGEDGPGFGRLRGTVEGLGDGREGRGEKKDEL